MVGGGWWASVGDCINLMVILWGSIIDYYLGSLYESMRRVNPLTLSLSLSHGDFISDKTRELLSWPLLEYWVNVLSYTFLLVLLNYSYLIFSYETIYVDFCQVMQQK